MKRLRKEKPCECARCRGLPTADQRYGFDKAAVPAVECLTCDKPIGDAEYELVPIFARFGQMFVKHKVCPT